MTEPDRIDRLPAELQAVLQRLRRRIRLYVVMEGLAIAVIWLAVTFWIGLALDYFPVMMGASEMPITARSVILTLIAVILGYILYRWILRRTWVNFRNSSLALLLEKRFPEIDDSLVTAVELHRRSDESSLHQAMLKDATRVAVEKVRNVRVGQVLNIRPLVGKLAVALLAVVSVGLFGIMAQNAFAIWSQRLYLLSDTPWPRNTFIEVVGFEEGAVKVAKGGNLTIRARATATAPKLPPDVCTIQYVTSDGERGRVNMNQSGGLRDGYQQYVFDGKPFQGVLSNIEFDVVGNDFRVRDLAVIVVPSPQILSVALDCTFPEYTGWYARQMEYSAGVKLARGTKVIATLSANKPLRRAEILDKSTNKITEVVIDKQETNDKFQYAVESLEETTELEITLHDVDGVTSQEPYRIILVAIPDTPPAIDVRLAGIGSAITPDALLPVTGKVTDDYGVGRLWFSLEYPEAPSREFPLTVPSTPELEATLDLQKERQASENPLQLAPESRVTFSLQAEDQYNLEASPHVAQGDRYELEIVTESQLVALLEARELALRQRFEQIIKEMRESRDSLARVAESPENAAETTTAELSAGAAPEDSLGENGNNDAPEQAQQRAAQLRLLRVQRANQHSERSAQEVLGVALSFDDIRLELINNRVDSEERQERIVSDIATPLRHIASNMLPILTENLRNLETALGQPEDVSTQVDTSLAQADEVVLAMEQVLEKMLDLESYNQLLDLVRGLIEEQESLIERTKEIRKKQALELLQ